MKPIISWFVHNPVAANLLMWMMLLAGLAALPNINQEGFPSIETDIVNITVPYPGATPTEIEESVCLRVEQAIEGIPGILTIKSSANEGACQVTAELVPDVDKARVVNDIKSSVDTITTFPAEAEEATVSQMTFPDRVANLAVFGEADERTLKNIGEKIREDLLAKPNISQVSLEYVRPYEISIEVSEQTLRRYGLTLNTISTAIKDSSIDLPAGSIKAKTGEVLVRTRAQAYTGSDFEQVVVLTRNDGTRLTLGDIANVVDGFAESDMRARFDGLPAMVITVNRVGDEDIVGIADTMKDYLTGIDSWLPASIKVVMWNNKAEDLVKRLEVLTNNAMSGLVLVLISLAIFLRLRLAFWVALGLPVAFLGTLATFPTLGLSISTLSVISFIMVIGILVDDAIVVAERVYAHHQMGLSWQKAAVVGTQEVSVPVIFGVFTSCATFLPLLFIGGAMGPFFAVIGYVIIIALFFSIIESQLILPAHLAHSRSEKKAIKNNDGSEPTQNALQRFQRSVSSLLERIVDKHYKPALRTAIKNRYLTLATGIGVIIVTIAMTASGWIVVQFFPPIDGVNITVKLTMPEGVPVSATNRAVAQLEKASEQLRAELDKDLAPDEPSKIRFIFSSVGSSLDAKNPVNASHVAEIFMELESTLYSLPPTTELANRWRELSGIIPDAVELTFSASSFSAGNPIDIELRGRSFDDLREVAAQLRQSLALYDGVYDITDSFRGGKQEIQLQLLPEARNLGLTSANLARQVRQAFFGNEVQRIQRGQDDIKVIIRYPEDERRSISDLEQMRIRTAGGVEIPFSRVAKISFGRGYSTIKREDGERIIRVVANVNRQVITPEEVLGSIESDVLPALLEQYPAVSSSFGGEAKQKGGAIFSLIKNFSLSLILVYALLAIPLRSYLQPLVIMSVIPFGAVGALLGHFIIRADVAFFSIMGMVALSGVVVNASLVLVDYINRERRSGVNVSDAVHAAGCVRFRPIILTSVTTFVGLLPLILSPAPEILFFMPMAISLAFGVLFSTAITLFLVPCLYLILEDMLTYFGASDSESKETGHSSVLD
jgi:multidrug efflux pump subunit AcrB